MKLLTLTAILTILLLAGSCRKETDLDPVQDSFPVHYYFINASASQLNAVNLKASTYFPKIDKTNVFYKSFPSVRSQDSLLILIDTSSVTKSWGYMGCKTQLEVNVLEQRAGSVHYVSTWLTNQNLINTSSNAHIYFVWPKDTLTAQKTAG